MHFWLKTFSTYNGFSGTEPHRKLRKICTDTCYNVDEPWKHYAKYEKPNTKGLIWFHLQEISRTGKYIETENRLVVDRSCGKWGWEWLLMSTGFCFSQEFQRSGASQKWIPNGQWIYEKGFHFYSKLNVKKYH